jgi:Pyrimidine dimer DNA glycosylase
MQTFLPDKDYKLSAQTLDNKRLNKQILEGYQILKVLSGATESGAWRNHPAVLMWKGSETHLMNYVNHMVSEADIRGIKTVNNVSNLKILKAGFGKMWGKNKPIWQKPEHIFRVIESHRANLYRKDSIIYSEYQLNTADPCCEKCLYYWPTHKERQT